MAKRGSTMGRKRRSYARGIPQRRKKPAFTLPLAVVAGLAPGLSQLWAAKKYGIQQIANVAARDYIGYDPDTGQMTTKFLGYGLYPVLAGWLVHALAGKFGINRMLGRASIPVLRI